MINTETSLLNRKLEGIKGAGPENDSSTKTLPKYLY